MDASISEDDNAPTVARAQPDVVDVEALKLDELKSLEAGRHVCRCFSWQARGIFTHE